MSFQWNSHEDITNLILFGHPVELLKSEYLWPSDRKFKFYTFSHAHRELLLETFPKLKSNQIHTIPRYSLFPIRKKFKENSIDWNHSLSLVYSGRADDDKHLYIVIKVAHLLQTNHNIDLQLIICGPDFVDDKIKPISQLAKSLKWKKKPLFVGDLGSNWMKKIPGRKVLMHLSTSLREDYGVSVAQAQQQGWPVILSDWGAHKDIDQGVFIKIPPQLILQEKTKDIVKHCLKGPPMTRSKKKKKTALKEVSYKQLIEIQKSYRVLDKKKINRILGQTYK